MKNLRFITLALSALLAFSCSKSDPESPQPYDPDNKPIKGTITLKVQIEELPSKIEFSVGNGSGYNWPYGIAMETYPPINVRSTNYVSNATNETPNDIEIDWGDGSITHMTSHTYERRGTYTITITGTGIKIFNDKYAKAVSVDVSKCSNIEALIIGQSVTSLDVSKNPHLISLAWSPAAQTTLNISKCPKIEHLEIGANTQTVDLKNCPMLQYLEYGGQYALDLSNAPLLAYLKISGQFSTLDLNKCPELRYLGCSSPNLATLKIDDCKKLQCISLTDCKIDEFTLDGYEKLCWFIGSRYIKKLTIKNSFKDYSEIGYIQCNGGGFYEYERSALEAIEITNCSALKLIEAYQGRLTSAKIENCTFLEAINVADNQLSSISLAGCTAYNSLNIAGNAFGDSGLNTVYNNLPVRETNPRPNIYITQNGGTGDTSIATSKGWKVVTQ